MASILDREWRGGVDGRDRPSAEALGRDNRRLHPARTTGARLCRIGRRGDGRAHLCRELRNRLPLREPEKPRLEPLLYENRVYTDLQIAALPQDRLAAARNRSRTPSYDPQEPAIVTVLVDLLDALDRKAGLMQKPDIRAGIVMAEEHFGA
jgi:hypothetical protein